MKKNNKKKENNIEFSNMPNYPLEINQEEIKSLINKQYERYISAEPNQNVILIAYGIYLILMEVIRIQK